MNGREDAIGVFDSGLGGLSVVREIQALLPAEPILYYADGAFFPYGEREPEVILARSLAIADELVGRGAKLLVVACNTASAVALEAIRARHPAVPVVGMVPAVKTAAAGSRAGRIAVLATPRTVGGGLLARVIREHAAGVEVILVPAPGLADLVEAGETDGPLVERALRPLLVAPLAAGVDVLVLGCTHYPFLAAAIRRLVGPGLALVDSGPAIARRAGHLLGAGGRLAADSRRGSFTLLTSGDEAAVGAVARRLMAQPANPAVDAGRRPRAGEGGLDPEGPRIAAERQPLRPGGGQAAEVGRSHGRD